MTSVEQDLYNKVRRHLLAQYQQSKRTVKHANKRLEKCAYRGDNGLQCALGCLINDEHYSKKMEGKGIYTPRVCNAVELSLGTELTLDQADLLASLQGIHNLNTPDKWRERLDKLAESWGLDVESG